MNDLTIIAAGFPVICLLLFIGYIFSILCLAAYQLHKNTRGLTYALLAVLFFLPILPIFYYCEHLAKLHHLI